MPKREVLFSHRLFELVMVDESFIHYCRNKERPNTVKEMSDAWQEALGLLGSTREKKTLSLVVDARQAAGNRDENFESQTLKILEKLRPLFHEIIVLLRTETGRLHTQRITRSSEDAYRVTLDEEEAFRWASEKK